jgi:hypothetical protein
MTMEALILLILVPVNFLPTLVALMRKHHNRTAIVVLNCFIFFFGWILPLGFGLIGGLALFLGWLVALIWACTAVRPQIAAPQIVAPQPQPFWPPPPRTNPPVIDLRAIELPSKYQGGAGEVLGAICITLTVIVSLVLLVRVASAEPAKSTTIYDARGNRLGSTSTTPSGTTNFYDAKGNRIGSATTTPGGTTNFYDARGNRTGSQTRR